MEDHNRSGSDYIPQSAPFTGRKMLLIMLGFFGVIIAVNMTMMRFALDSFGGLVVGNAYVVSQRFDDDRAVARAQPIMTWDVAVRVSPGAPAEVVVSENGRPTTGLALSLRVGRPSHGREDRTLLLAEAAPGVYGAADALPAGLWRATLATDDGQIRTLIDPAGPPRSQAAFEQPESPLEARP